MTKGRNTRRYKMLREQFKQTSTSNQSPCWLCGMSIDYTIPWPDEQAFELDHLYPVSTHPEHSEDPANFRPSHRDCNNRRGNKMPVGGLGKLNRQWLK